jgi:hypothetical protein
LKEGYAPGGLRWKPGQIIFTSMLRAGWAWISYLPAVQIRFAMVPHVVQQRFAAAADQFSLLQIGQINITLVTTFDGLVCKQPHHSANKTLRFAQAEFPGFAGPFGAALTWMRGGDAPASNFLYCVSSATTGGIDAYSLPKIDGERRARWGVELQVSPPADVPPGMVLCRISVSVVHALKVKLIDRPNPGVRLLVGTRHFVIPASLIDHFHDGQWQPADL